MHRLTCLLLVTTSCTHWSSTTVYGQRYEVERRLLGSPAIEESSSSNVSGGFQHDSASETDRYGHHTFHQGASFGSFGGEHSSSKLTHCVQQAEIHYKQPYQVVPVSSGRWLDVAGGISAMLMGGMIMAMGEAAAQTTIPASSDTPTLVIGTAVIAGGIGLLAYSFGRLPKGEAPKAESGEQDVVETDYVEATGCGLPGDPTVRR